MEKERRIKGLSLVALVVAVLGLTVAFAALSTQLTIEGSANVAKASWNVHFANLTGPTVSGKASAGEMTSDLGIQANTTTIKLPSMTLTMPDDTITYTVDVVNSGTIDAKVEAIPTCTKTVSATATDTDKNAADKKMVEDNFICKLTYSDDTEVIANDDLASNGGTKKMKLTIGYSDKATEVPSNDVNISDITVTMTYVQK